MSTVSFWHSGRFLYKIYRLVCTIATRTYSEDTHGRRYSTYVQRLWTGFYVYRCGSGVLPGTRLFDPQTLQALPYGKEERTRWGRLRVSSGSIPWNTCDLLRLRPAHHCSI